jgi:hypothetical protein
MPDVSFTPEDIVSSQEMPAGFYPVALEDVTEGPGQKDPRSTTWACEFKVVDGPFTEAVIQHWFSNKMMKNVINFVRCFVKNLEPGKSYPLEETKGKPVMAYVKYDMDRNANVIVSFKPIGK